MNFTQGEAERGESGGGGQRRFAPVFVEIADEVVANAPETQDHFFLVPKVVE